MVYYLRGEYQWFTTWEESTSDLLLDMGVLEVYYLRRDGVPVVYYLRGEY